MKEFVFVSLSLSVSLDEIEIIFFSLEFIRFFFTMVISNIQPSQEKGEKTTTSIWISMDFHFLSLTICHPKKKTFLCECSIFIFCCFFKENNFLYFFFVWVKFIEVSDIQEFFGKSRFKYCMFVHEFSQSKDIFSSIGKRFSVTHNDVLGCLFVCLHQ